MEIRIQVIIDNDERTRRGRIASCEILLTDVVASCEMSPLLSSRGGHHGHGTHPCGTN
jgi:hypothetical protein